MNMKVEEFIDRWKPSGGSELGNYQGFLTELCDLIGAPKPDPVVAEEEQNRYVFEKRVYFKNQDGSQDHGRIDLYKNDCFVLEAKQGADKYDGEKPLFQKKPLKRRKGHALRDTGMWDVVMEAAKGQAERYAKALNEWPPFLMVTDVGHVIEVYSDFDRNGKGYFPFPDPRTYRIKLEDLRDEKVRERLRLIWTDPMSLDPSKKAAEVTRDVAMLLAELAKKLEAKKHKPNVVADFLTRLLFTMFAEDVGLLPEMSFTLLLEKHRDNPDALKKMIEQLWEAMDKGGFSYALAMDVLQFNGRFFHNKTALPLETDMIDLLIDAAYKDWTSVEPAIFGTLLERALDPTERHKLGAHFTPRAYVERLVMPTIIEPLRKEFKAVKTAALTLANKEAKTEKAEKKNRAEAARQLKDFQSRLCNLRILDPACGSGNFLYVTLEHMKRLEGEVLQTLNDIGETQTMFEMKGVTVDPHQFLGIEINPRAAALAELVLWIGYLQWHFRTHGQVAPPEPVLRDFRNIECRDAILEYDEKIPRLDKKGNPVTVWDMRTYKKSPINGKDVPDETAQIPVYDYTNPRPAQWPDVDYIVSNPPFIGNWRMRQMLGEGYAEVVRKTYKKIPESCDYVMFWWEKAAVLTRQGKINRFGFITTNSLKQTFSRRVLARHLSDKKPLSLVFAIPDHPWVDSADGAAVRIAMTVGQAGQNNGNLFTVLEEVDTDNIERNVSFNRKVGFLNANLSIGVDVSKAVPLLANKRIAMKGIQLMGAGFILTSSEAKKLGYNKVKSLNFHIRPFLNGKDVMHKSRNVMVIDLFGLNEKQVRDQFPPIYQWIYERVKPERDQNKRKSYRERWWIFGEPRSELRKTLDGLKFYIATSRTAKHRVFTKISTNVLPESGLVAIALEDNFYLGILSSRFHVFMAKSAGGYLGVGNDPVYNTTKCFDPFPFPDANEGQKALIRELGERLDAHRKKVQADFPDATLTAMYNALARLREIEQGEKNGEKVNPLSDKERAFHDRALIGILKQIHDDLDQAVADAYGWPADLSDEEILEKLVALNHERAEEEKNGKIRWLRPEFQAPDYKPEARQEELSGMGEKKKPAAPKKKAPWPENLVDRVQAVQEAVESAQQPLTVAQVAKSFSRARKDAVVEILDMLTQLGHLRQLDNGKYGL